ncbi:MAG: VTT domain-containing protein [Acidobacteria bacterium]|nr:VTT domain-containing protein [Acidobacteriota bacterium]
MFRWILLLLGALALAVVPFLIWGSQVDTWVGRFVESRPPGWVSALVLAGLLAADIVAPVPSSIISTAAGALLGFPGGLITSWLGMNVACIAGYSLGASTTVDIAKIRRARDRYGDWVLVLFRPVPVLAEASVLFAGLTRTSRPRFVVLTFGANLGISAVYSAAGAWSSQKETFLYAFIASMLVPGVLLLAARRLAGS